MTYTLSDSVEIHSCIWSIEREKNPTVTLIKIFLKSVEYCKNSVLHDQKFFFFSFFFFLHNMVDFSYIG